MAARDYLERMVLGRERGPLSWAIRGSLWPLSLLYQGGLAAFLAVYDRGLRRRHRLPVPVVSVGNITFGGTGKTPAVQAICRMLTARGKRAVVLSRGHGGTVRGSVVVSDGSSIVSDASEAGDEPVLLAWSLPSVPVVVGKDRRKSGELACRAFRPDVIVLDDGLQYWQLSRDLDIVVLSAAEPFGSGYVMPMGDLREPVSGLRRAGIVLLSNSRGVSREAYNDVVSEVSRLAPDARVFACNHRPRRICVIGTEEEHPPEWLRGRNMSAFCGIGRPLAFFEMLESLGAILVEKIAFPDHHEFSPADIQRVHAMRQPIITTEKDAVRLDGAVSGLLTLGIELEIEDFDAFADHINKRIEETQTTAASVSQAAD